MDSVTKDVIRLLVDPKDSGARERLTVLDAENLAADGSIKTRIEELVAELAERYPEASPAVRGELARSQAAAERQKAEGASALAATK